jgi:hypothetical protein
MIPPIITKRLSRKKIWELADADAFAEYNRDTKQHTIYIPYRASTKTRLHEIAHCEKGHCLSHKTRMPVSQFVANEIEAEEDAFSKCGKQISVEAIDNIIHEAIALGASHSPVFNATVNALARHNYRLDKKSRSDLWHKCRDFESERKSPKTGG